MYRLAIATAIAASACGEAGDDRPRNLDYITEAILAPSCGGATCHSSFRQADGYAFDNVDGARASFQGDPALILPDPNGPEPGDPGAVPGLMLNLTVEQPGAPRMPYAEPLPDLDLDLLERWLKEGAPGVCIGGNACLGQTVVPCTSTGAYQLSALGSPDAIDCTDEGADSTCVKGECLPRADLAITVAATPDPVAAGGMLTYTIGIDNLGPTSARLVTVDNALPPTAVFVSAGGTGWECGTPTDQVVTCTLASLDVASASPISLVVMAPATAGMLTYQANVTSAAADLIKANNAAVVTSVVTP